MYDEWLPCERVSSNLPLFSVLLTLNTFLPSGVPRTGIEFTSGSLDELTTYKFNTKVFVHHFCPTCGIELMCSNTGADTMGVNVRSVDGIELEKLKLHWFDGKNAL